MKTEKFKVRELLLSKLITRHVLFCIIIFNFFKTNHVNAQYRLGFKGGVNMSSFIEPKTKNNLLTTYAVGVTMEKFLSKRLSVSWDLIYSRQGNIAYFNNPGVFDRVRTKYDYIILPISFRYNLKKYPIFVSPGLQAGYLTNSKVEFLPKNGSTSNIVPFLRTFDLGYSAQLGYRLGHNFIIETKYYKSLMNVFDNSVTLQRKNQVFSIGASFYIL